MDKIQLAATNLEEPMNKLLFTLITFFALSVLSTLGAQTQGNKNPAVAPSKSTTPTLQLTIPPVPPASAASAANSASSSTGEVSCGCELPLPEVLASVNGVKIAAKDIEAPNSPLEQQKLSIG